MNEITIKYEDLSLLVDNSKQISLTPSGETFLIKFLTLSNAIETAFKNIKTQIGDAILAVDPDLTSISSDNVKVMYRVYGAKYNIDKNIIKDIDKKYYKKNISYSPDTKAIDKEIKENGVLPTGVSINERNKTVSVTLKNKE